MRIQSPRMDSRRSWLSAKPNVTVKREVPSDSAKLNGIGCSRGALAICTRCGGSVEVGQVRQSRWAALRT